MDSRSPSSLPVAKSGELAAMSLSECFLLSRADSEQPSYMDEEGAAEQGEGEEGPQHAEGESPGDRKGREPLRPPPPPAAESGEEEACTPTTESQKRPNICIPI